MAILTTKELAVLRQGISRKFKPETWLKQDLSAAFQSVENTQVLAGLVMEDAVDEVTTTDSRAQGVANEKGKGVFTGGLKGLLPIVEDWLAENPATSVERSVKEAQLTAWLTLHEAAFTIAVANLPSEIRSAIVLDLLRMQVKKIL